MSDSCILQGRSLGTQQRGLQLHLHMNQTISCCCSELAQCSGTRGPEIRFLHPSLAKPTWMESVRVLFNPLHAREEPKFVHRNYAIKKRRLRELRALKRDAQQISGNACSRGGHHQRRKSTNLKRTRRLLFFK
jgi:hypothetical protein